MPPNSHFSGVNLLGTMFLHLYSGNILLNYAAETASLFFTGPLDEIDEMKRAKEEEGEGGWQENER